MAQGAISSMPAHGSANGLTEEQRLELLEYEKIVRFRDTVFSGSHPRIKLPPHLAAQPAQTTTSTTNVPQTHSGRAALIAPAPPSQTITNKEKDTSAPGAREGGAQKEAEKAVENIPGIGKTNNADINPIFLEKGPALVKAELKLRREKIEKELREQVERERTAGRLAVQTGVEEQVPDFDVHEVLAKAIAIARNQPPTVADAKGAVARSIASDSFDDNTFYSSAVESPEASTGSRARRESGEIPTRPLLPLHAQSGANSHSGNATTSQNQKVANAPLSRSDVPGLKELDRVQSPRAPQLASQDQQQSLPARPPSGPARLLQQNQNSREGFSSNQVGNSQEVNNSNNFNFNDGNNGQQVGTEATRMDLDQRPITQDSMTRGTKQHANAAPPNRPLSADEPSDIRRNFNLSPVAPQPVRVSPLATAKQPPFAQQNFALDGSQTFSPLQARNDGSTTGGSSGQGQARPGEKQKGKRKLSSGKSAAHSNAAGGSPNAVYIKPEPRSPSPFNPAPLPRPHKRARQGPQQNGGLDYDEPRFDEPRPLPPPPRQQPRQGNARRLPREPRQPRDEHHEFMEIDEPQYRQVLQDEPQQRRILGRDVPAGPLSPRNMAVPYSPYEQRMVRPVSRMVIDPYAETPRYQATPASARPVELVRDGTVSPVYQDRNSPVMMMAPPPRVAERRLLMDEYGRQYYASIPVVPRQSMIPQSRVVEQDYIFDRPPPRAMARPVQHVYEEDGVYYKREPTYIPQRRVVTMPDDQIDSPYQREFSVRPAPLRQPAAEHDVAEPMEVRPRDFSRRLSIARAPADNYARVADDEYVRIMDPPPRREMAHLEQPQIVRVGSVRPEQNRYGAPVREYVTSRAQSIRPDAQTPVRREFAASVRPEARGGETPMQNVREYSVRPTEGMPPPRREYVQPMDAYQPVRRVARMVDDDIEYVAHQPVRQVARGAEDDIRYAPRREVQQEAYGGQPQYLPRRQAQQEIYEDDVPQQVVYR